MTEVIEKTENKKGYKKTKLGWIPKDWDVIKLGNIATEIKDKVGKKQRIPMSLSAGKGFVAQAKKFGKDIAGKQYAQYTCLPPRTFAYNKGNSLKYPQGCIYQQPFNEEVAVPNVFICFVLDKNYCNNNFYEQLFKNNAQGKELFKYINSGVRNDGLLNLNDNNFFKIKLVLPPLKEQEKIAKILSAWDDGIETLEKLIEQREILKKAIMQKLFFEKESWQMMRFDKIFKDFCKKNCPRERLLSATQENGVIPRDMLSGKVMSPEGSLEGYKLIEVGDFVISLRSFQGGLEYSKYRGILSPAYTVLKNIIDIDKDFYRHFFKSYNFIKKYLSISVIGIRDGKQVSYSDLSSVKIPYPPLEEQKKIGKILNCCDKEIQILNSKLEKLKEQKKGLMQKLLTGQIRVKV